jgi:hypothetical protein
MLTQALHGSSAGGQHSSARVVHLAPLPHRSMSRSVSGIEVRSEKSVVIDEEDKPDAGDVHA